MHENGGAAEAWETEYRAGRYESEPPVPFVADIVSGARSHGLGNAEGLYVGCGNGRNHLWPDLNETKPSIMDLEAAGCRRDQQEPDQPDQRAIADAYARAFEAADIEAIKKLLVDDAVLEMPPVPLWYRGRQNYAEFIGRVFSLRGRDWRMERVIANGQPALAAYCRAAEGAYAIHTLQVFTVVPAGICRNVVFQDPRVFDAFGLPTALPPEGRP